MKSIIKALCKGTINFTEIEYTDDLEYRKTINEIRKIKIELRDRLSTEDYNLIDKLFDLQSEISSIDNAAWFKKGFCLGTLIAVEVATSDEAGECE